MIRLSNPERRRRRGAIDAAVVLVILLLMVQMWLLTASLESFLAGHAEVALPAFLTSIVLLVACLALYWLVVRLDRAPEIVLCKWLRQLGIDPGPAQ